jgi:serine/threonine protein kinase
LRHPNIVIVYGACVVNDELWIVMELADGGSLTSVLTNKDIVSTNNISQNALNMLCRIFHGIYDGNGDWKQLHQFHFSIVKGSFTGTSKVLTSL